MWVFFLHEGVQPSDGVVLTTAGKLPIKHIIHMVGQTKEKEITNCMYKVLKKCEENKIQSVSFPALGTGKCNYAVSTKYHSGGVVKHDILWTRFIGKNPHCIVVMQPDAERCLSPNWIIFQ